MKRRCRSARRLPRFARRRRCLGISIRAMAERACRPVSVREARERDPHTPQFGWTERVWALRFRDIAANIDRLRRASRYAM